MHIFIKPIALCLIAAGPVFAQCSPQRLEPTDFGSRFGGAIGLHGEHLVIGDQHDTSLCVVDPSCANGLVYSYRHDGESWVFDQPVTPVGHASRMAFGAAVALDGDRMIVGAPGDGAGGGLGAAYIFQFDGIQWQQTTQLDVPGPVIANEYGVQTALHADTALVMHDFRMVHVYRMSRGDWDFVETIWSPLSSGTATAFGTAMAVNDDWLFIGDSVEDSFGRQYGAVYVYRWDSQGRPMHVQTLSPPDTSGVPRFGSAIALDGNTLAVGAYTSTRTVEGQGAVHMFNLEGDRWEHQQELVHDDPKRNDFFGEVALSGESLVIGAFFRDTPASFGQARLYHRDPDGLWQFETDLIPEQHAFEYGVELALDGDTVAVGASGTRVADIKRGSVDLFDIACYQCAPDLDGDSSLTLFDFLMFQNLFQDGDAVADFDGDGELTLFDFLAFQDAFRAGC